MSDLVHQSVLIVDDSLDIHQLVGARLRSERVNLLHAYDAAEGFQLARAEQPDLILLDLDMPNTDGMTLCRQLKAEYDLSLIPVIFLTGTIDVQTKVQAFELGAVDYVTKPFDAIELKARVRSALRTKRYHDLLTTKAQIDAMTGLWNRGYFNDRLTVEMSVLERKGRPVAVAMVDIDHFKPINDTYGHPFGDTVIQRIAVVLSSVSRDSDVVCRYGGEEFAIILRDTPSAGAMTVAKRIREAVEALILTFGRTPVPVTVSIGVAGSDEIEDSAGVTSETLLEAADRALYRAKGAGRNRVEG
ncbi:response regulator receiver modulated diguanylate cyclase [Marinobacter daqiaonensis]|uniref:diguanylate cyclase n=1 Tax=Marinobacter daqiaonensis TaxID=650891 RepID=A0A1I6JT74_9GAMM|nr:diguanylate cyclase [Marinobacter daqiaonensis]SFR82157.1 response regulator receiver modulated diguanylate cyclase [Marinobacter daqiaonensis]